MRREFHVRFCEGLGVQLPRATRLVVGFQRQADAERFGAALRERLAKFGLDLNRDKTRLIEFGRFAAENRRTRGLRKPETFDFLGFTHICGSTRSGKFLLVRRTMRKRMRAKLREVKAELMRRRHLPLPIQGMWLARVVQGHANYYAVPTNIFAVAAFHREAVRLWHRALSRRSQKGRVRWARMARYRERWIPSPRVLHPWPEERFDVRTRGRSPVR